MLVRPNAKAGTACLLPRAMGQSHHEQLVRETQSGPFHRHVRVLCRRRRLRPEREVHEPANRGYEVNETEGVVYIRHEDEAGYDTIEPLEAMRDNWNKLMDAAELTPEERREAVELFQISVGIFPGTQIG